MRARTFRSTAAIASVARSTAAEAAAKREFATSVADADKTNCERTTTRRIQGRADMFLESHRCHARPLRNE